ncbi:hypothetical protein M8818_006706 [Zalaria obscura]|uniref:Uncharacterized protein n=1 Tax=Zalaria obscura TaxID=2024903 RepID=A0ACC3S4P7_9PEZI
MPKFLAPRKSGVHRVAAIALYRTLLSQCGTIPFADEQKDALRNVVRNRFRSNLNRQGGDKLRTAFTAGYEAVTHLDASASGNEESTSLITTILSQVHTRLTLPPGAPWPPRSDAPTESPEPLPPPKPKRAPGELILSRPLPLDKLTGPVRRIPILVNANHVPILRLTKPQPHHLTMYIKRRVEQRQRRHDRKWVLHEDIALSKQEDEWDELIGQKGQKGEGKWADEQEKALDEVEDSLEREQAKNRRWTAKLSKIVDEEKALAEEEKLERKRAKNRRRMARKRERLAAEDKRHQNEERVEQDRRHQNEEKVGTRGTQAAEDDQRHQNQEVVKRGVPKLPRRTNTNKPRSETKVEPSSLFKPIRRGT